MNKYLIITGGSRGIGEQTIHYFLEQGWKAINLSRSPCKMTGVINFSVDLSSVENIHLLGPLLASAVCEPSVLSLVHNAAFYKKDSIDTLSLTDLQTTLAVNIVSSAALNKIFIPLMRPGSSILYIGSTLATKAVPGSASYIIAKHALIGLMKATCQDLIKKQIHTSCICPGLVDTQLLKDAVDEITIKHLLNTQVMGRRLIDPQEIAQIIYFCAMNPTINGATIHANLGQETS